MSEKSNGTTRTLLQILGWNRTSYILMSSFALLLFIIGYVWWPLVEEYLSTYNPELPFWMQFDWLLLSIFFVMSLLLMAKADIKKDLPIIFVGLAGGLVIESWGTQTELWFYYTFERPPLWIIPAWPIASLSIDRLYQLLNAKSEKIPSKIFQISYWLIFIGFYIYMLYFIWPTLDKSLTIMALFLCAFIILTPVNQRAMLLTFIAGSGLGYFLELWGTTRYCWTYYTFQTPPFFAVLAHGMAAVAFWRVVQLFWIFEPKSNQFLQKILKLIHNKKSTV
jgi:hypothetical protein